MGDGLPLYHIDRVVRENGKSFDDGSHIIYVNGSYKNDEDPVGRLMHDFGCHRASNMFYWELAKQVKYYKETEGDCSISSGYRFSTDRNGVENVRLCVKQ